MSAHVADLSKLLATLALVAVACSTGCDRGPTGPPEDASRALPHSAGANVPTTFRLVREVEPAQGDASGNTDVSITNEEVTVTREEQAFGGAFRVGANLGLSQEVETQPPPEMHVFAIVKVYCKPSDKVALKAPVLTDASGEQLKGYTPLRSTGPPQWGLGVTRFVYPVGGDVSWLYVVSQDHLPGSTFELMGHTYRILSP